MWTFVSGVDNIISERPNDYHILKSIKVFPDFFNDSIEKVNKIIS